MFDIGWSEMLVIAVVMIVVVGPKDLPKMLRTIGKMTSKVRGMAGDFQRQFNDALKEAELDDVKKSVDELRGLNPAAQIRKHVDPFQQAAADVRKGLDAVMKPKPAEPPAPAVPNVHEAEPLKNGAIGGSSIGVATAATGEIGTVGAAMTGTAASPPASSVEAMPHNNGATVEIISPDAPTILPPINAAPVEIVSPDAPKPKRASPRAGSNGSAAKTRKLAVAKAIEPLTEAPRMPSSDAAGEVVSSGASQAKAATRRRGSTTQIKTAAGEGTSSGGGRKKPGGAA